MPRPNVPEKLIPAYFDDALVHAVFTQGAQRGEDERETLIALVLALVEAKKQAVAAHVEHLQNCPGHWVPSV
jgi:hypothetical protein